MRNEAHSSADLREGYEHAIRERNADLANMREDLQQALQVTSQQQRTSLGLALAHRRVLNTVRECAMDLATCKRSAGMSLVVSAFRKICRWFSLQPGGTHTWQHAQGPPAGPAGEEFCQWTSLLEVRCRLRAVCQLVCRSVSAQAAVRRMHPQR